jgi:hypothetical protein
MLKRASRHAQHTTKKEADEPAELHQVQSLRRFEGGHRAHAPHVRQKRRGNAKAHHIGKRIKLLPEFAVRAHRARHAPIK